MRFLFGGPWKSHSVHIAEMEGTWRLALRQELNECMVLHEAVLSFISSRARSINVVAPACIRVRGILLMTWNACLRCISTQCRKIMHASAP